MRVRAPIHIAAAHDATGTRAELVAHLASLQHRLGVTLMERTSLERFGSVGAIIAAAACPICFPKLALVGAALGLGIFAPYEGYVAKGVQALFLLALAGQLLAFRQHRNQWLFALSGVTTALLFVGYYVVPSSVLLQGALLGLVISSIWLIVEQRRYASCARLPQPSVK
jgi:mercuric ion transport protein